MDQWEKRIYLSDLWERASHRAEDHDETPGSQGLPLLASASGSEKDQTHKP